MLGAILGDIVGSPYEENLHYLYQISTGDYAARAVILKDISPESEFRRDFLFFIVKAGSCSFAEMATH